MLSGLSLSKENVTIRSNYESILRFYGYDLGDEGSGGMQTTTVSNKRQQDDDDEKLTTIQTPTQTTDVLTTLSPNIPTETTITDRATVKLEPSSTENYENKATEAKVETTTFIPTEGSTEATTTKETAKIPVEPAKITSTEKPTTTTTVPTTLPPALPTTLPTTFPTTMPTQLPYLSEITTPFVQTTNYPTSRFTYSQTEELTVLPVTEMISTTPKPSHIFTFKPITTTPLPEPITTTKRFYNLQTTIPPLSALTDSTNTNILNSLTTVPVPTAIRLNPSEISNARLVNPRTSRIYRFKREPSSYNSFIPLAPSGYGITSDANLYDPYFNYATPNPPDLYYPEGNPIFATRDFDQIEHHHDEIDHIFYLNPHDSIRIGFKVYNTILRFAYIPEIQASALELPLDSENYSLLIIVPDQPIDDLVNVLGSHLSPSLVDIRAALRNNWIKTMIPKFQLKGNVVLTGDLMKVCVTVLSLNVTNNVMKLNSISDRDS